MRVARRTSDSLASGRGRFCRNLGANLPNYPTHRGAATTALPTKTEYPRDNVRFYPRSLVKERLNRKEAGLDRRVVHFALTERHSDTHKQTFEYVRVARKYPWFLSLLLPRLLPPRKEGWKPGTILIGPLQEEGVDVRHGKCSSGQEINGWFPRAKV